MALAIRLAGDGTARHLSSLSQSMTGAPPPQRAMLALAGGRLLREGGGMTAAASLEEIVSALVTAACDPSGGAHVWAVHALWLAADAAGPAFVSTPTGC